ncbi:MAG: aldehyde-activating protein [Pacificimonas sp.]
MTAASCHCGAVSVSPARRPDFMFDCNCSLCMKAGAQWGYYDPSEVDVVGRTSRYTRADHEGSTTEIHFCPNCGSTTHFSAVAGDRGMIGVNMRLYAPDELVGIETRFPDGRNWSGEGEWGYYRGPRT